MDDDRIFRKCVGRLMPLMAALLVMNYVDRVNVGFAALTMNRDLGFSFTVFGFGAGIIYFSYSLSQVPANAILTLMGVRRWITCIMVAWGMISAACALVQSPVQFYVLRFLLGMAEAGLYPGMMFYLTLWFPKGWRARLIALFSVAIPVAFVIGGPVSGLLLELDGLAGLRGWQWLFLLEGLPSILLGLAVLKVLPDGPAHAGWLTRAEKDRIAQLLSAETAGPPGSFWSALRDLRVVALGIVSCGFVVGMSLLLLWLPQMVQAMGYSHVQTGLVVAAIFAVAIPAMILWARHSDASGERVWHTVIAGLVAAIGFAIAGTSQDHLIALIGFGLAAMGIYAYYGPFFSLPSTFLAGSALASGFALLNCIATIGGWVGPLAMGALKQNTGGYAAGLYAAAAVHVCAALLLLLLGRRIAPFAKPAPAMSQG